MLHGIQQKCKLANSSSWSKWAFSLNVLLESSSTPDPSLSNYRAENANLEEQLFSRIRDLEAHLAHGLPPQLNPGEYEHLVRGLLENSINVHHYLLSSLL